MKDTVSLEGLEFFAFHGCHKEEKKIGGRFIVDISVSFDLEKAAQKDNLAFTVDYTVIYALIKKEMEHHSNLLEHVGLNIIKATFVAYPTIRRVTVSVSKQNPPIGGICKAAKVTLTRSFPE